MPDCNLPPPLTPRPVMTRRARAILLGRVVAEDVHEVLQAYADLLGHPECAAVPAAVRDRAERLRLHYWIARR